MNIDLRQGDCLDVMKTMEDGCVDLTITSPPYDNLRTYNDNIDQWCFEKFQKIAKELYRITANGGVIVWIVSDATNKGTETLTSFRQALYFKEIGFNVHDTMIWEKQTFTDTGSLRVRYGNVFEYMFVLVKGKLKTFNPLKDRENKQVGKKKSSTVRQPDGSFRMQSSIGKKRGEYGQRFNVWQINTCVSNAERTGHPAQFPEQLANDHIISWSNEGDTVFDPFMGSGTTGKMALLNNRNFIGVELDEEYFGIAKKRIEECGLNDERYGAESEDN